jgi:uncharacterized protein (TIGR03086 family)
MQTNDLVASATAEAARVLRGVGPDHLAAPTPCGDWDVRTLGNHLLQVVSALALAGRGAAVPDELWKRDLTVDGWSARFDDAAGQAVAAWADPVAPHRTVTMGSADMPAPFVAAMLVADLTIHGWDLARATGQDFHCAENVAESAYRFVAETAEQGRGMGLYGVPVPVSESAPALDRALGLSGRDPNWPAPSQPADKA